MTLRTMSSNDAKQHWGSVMNTVSNPDDAVIVESHGRPKVAVISYDRFERLRELEDKARREWALGQLRQLEERLAERNRDLTDQEIDELAIRAGREINRAVGERGLAKSNSSHADRT